MARAFGPYSPAVPLGVTWEESLLLEDENETPIDLTGYDVRAQFYVDAPMRDPLTGLPVVAPVIEITSAGHYTVPPTWPVLPVAVIAVPTSGLITFAVPPGALWAFSPTNAKQKLAWSIVLVNPTTGYAIPVVQGRPTFLPAVTI